MAISTLEASLRAHQRVAGCGWDGVEVKGQVLVPAGLQRGVQKVNRETRATVGETQIFNSKSSCSAAVLNRHGIFFAAEIKH